MRIKLIAGFVVSIGYIGFLIKNICKRNFAIIKITNPIKTYKKIISFPVENPYDI